MPFACDVEHLNELKHEIMHGIEITHVKSLSLLPTPPDEHTIFIFNKQKLLSIVSDVTMFTCN